MPNWCFNTLNCSKDVATKILTKDKDGNYTFSFETIIPSPKTKEECDPKYYVKEDSYIQILEDRPWFNWYDWQCANWGCKWDCYVTDITETEDGFTITFETPWSYPEPILRTLCRMFPEQVSGYCEEEANCWNPFSWDSYMDGEMDIYEEEIEDDDEDNCTVII